MARFTNQAQLTYGTTVVNSNIAVGEVLDTLAVEKTVVDGTYAPGDEITYVVSVRNTGATPVTGVTVTDNLGAYPYAPTGATLTPLTYVADSVNLYLDGVLSAAPTVTPGPPLVFSGITIPAGGNAILVYKAAANEFAPLGPGESVTNVASVTAHGIATPSTDDATAAAVADPRITITKTIDPVPVAEDGVVTYTFRVENYGATALDAAAGAVVTDTFTPPLTNLAVTLNGQTLAPGTGYGYTGNVFTTVAGQLTVPAATYERDATGAVTVIPGVSTLVVTGNI